MLIINKLFCFKHSGSLERWITYLVVYQAIADRAAVHTVVACIALVSAVIILLAPVVVVTTVTVTVTK